MLPTALVKSSRLILAFGCALMECDCSRNREVKGEIVIVTGHASVKLGLVEVQAFLPAHVNPVVAFVKSQIGEQEASLEPIGKQIQALKTRATNDQQQIRNASRDVSLRFGDRIDSFINDCTTLSNRVLMHRQYLHSAARFFEPLPNALATAKSDSDGKFMIAVPRSSETIICATADHEVANSTEHYHWMVKVPQGANASITLSNDNLATAGSPQSVIHASFDSSGREESIEDLRTEVRNFETELNALESDLVAARQTPLPVQPEAAEALPHSVTLKQSVSVQLRDGSVVLLPAGGQFEFVSKKGSEVHIRYRDGEYAIPLSATDLK